MRSAIGNSLLMNIVIIIVSTIIIIFVSILSYSKAYRVKNRIIEVIENYGSYENPEALEEITQFLKQSGYQLGNCEERQESTGNPNIGLISNSSGYKYCVERKSDNPSDLKCEMKSNGDDGTGYKECKGKHYYRVTTYVEFNFPVIDSLLKVPVSGETKTLGIDYDDYN